MNPFLTFRVATHRDNILLAQLGRETFEQAFATANTPEDMGAYLAGAFSPEWQALELAEPQNIFWLFYSDEICVGYVKIFTGPAAPCISHPKTLKIARLYLLQNWCGLGIGSEMLNRLCNYGRENGFDSVWLTVWEQNTRALALYQRAGFKIVGDEDFILGRDVQHDFIMEKVLV